MRTKLILTRDEARELYFALDIALNNPFDATCETDCGDDEEEREFWERETKAALIKLDRLNIGIE